MRENLYSYSFFSNTKFFSIFREYLKMSIKWFSNLVILLSVFFSSHALAIGLKGDFNKEVNCLAMVIMYESQAEPIKGKKGVANVILNRMKSEYYPDTVCQVISQRGQFQWYHNHSLRGGRKYSPTKNIIEYLIAEQMLTDYIFGNRNDNTKGAIFFNANGTTPSKRAYKTVKIGGHQFLGLNTKGLQKW